MGRVVSLAAMAVLGGRQQPCWRRCLLLARLERKALVWLRGLPARSRGVRYLGAVQSSLVAVSPQPNQPMFSPRADASLAMEGCVALTPRRLPQQVGQVVWRCHPWLPLAVSLGDRCLARVAGHCGPHHNLRPSAGYARCRSLATNGNHRVITMIQCCPFMQCTSTRRGNQKSTTGTYTQEHPPQSIQHPSLACPASSPTNPRAQCLPLPFLISIADPLTSSFLCW